MRYKIRYTVAKIISLLGVLCGAYVGGWLLFIKPILDCAVALDTGSISSVLIAVSLLKCIFSSIVGFAIAAAGIIMGEIISR